MSRLSRGQVDKSGVSRRRLLSGAALGLPLGTGSLATGSRPGYASGGIQDWAVDPEDTYVIGRITGENSPNRTGSRWGIYGTDLGHMLLHRGTTYVMFGDTFGFPGRPGAEVWINNALAWTRQQDPSKPLWLDGAITRPDGRAKELIPKNAVPGNEVPTNAVSLGKRMLMHYMAVNRFEGGGHWSLKSSGLAYSDDDGLSWRLSDVTWPGDSNFGQVAFVLVRGYVYMFGIPGGRHGSVQLARMPRQAALEKEWYEYWDGNRWVRNRPEAAATVVDGKVGEFAVRWNSHYNKWLMTHHDVEAHAASIRTADYLVGPWSRPRVIVTQEEIPSLYAPYLPPKWNNSADIYFTLSRFDKYDVYWWHTSLSPAPNPAPAARLVQP